MKVLTLLLLFVGLGFVYQSHRSDSEILRGHYDKIELAAQNLELPLLNELSAASSSDFQRAYIEYRLALAAEQSARLADMEAAFDRSLALLDKLSRLDTNADIYALSAAIHLKRLSLGQDTQHHSAALDRALMLGQQLNPEHPGVLMVAAKAMSRTASRKGARTAMADLLKHEAEIQLDRHCNSACPNAESSYIWQGLAQALEAPTKGDPDHALLARCNNSSPLTHGS